MPTSPSEAAVPFAYRAQTPEGATVTGTIDAAGADDARWRLKALSLRVFDLAPAADATPKPARLRSEDFAAFNQQLAQLASAGMPIETGLRLIAKDMRSRRLGRAVEAVAQELERGTPLPDAFARHSASFPALYGRVLEAGVKAGDLPGILLNLGRHLDLMQQLRRALWRAASYPLMALVAFCGVLLFIGLVVAPNMRQILPMEDVQLPALTRIVFAVAEHMPQITLWVFATLAAGMAALLWVQITGREQILVDRLVLPLPLIGAVVRANLVARWCDAVGLAVSAGLDLPRAVDLAAQATGSPAVRRDSDALLSTHSAGQPLQAAGTMRVLTPTVLAATEMGRSRGDLRQVLAMLTQMYQRNSEHYLGLTVAVLSPLFIMAIGALLASVIAAVFLPLVKLIQIFSS